MERKERGAGGRRVKKRDRGSHLKGWRWGRLVLEGTRLLQLPPNGNKRQGETKTEETKEDDGKRNLSVVDLERQVRVNTLLEVNTSHGLRGLEGSLGDRSESSSGWGGGKSEH